MKSRKLMCITAITLFAALAIPVWLAAQEARTFTVLYSFTGGADGANPYAGLARDASGNLYGTTEAGGETSCNSPSGCGTVFKVDTTGKQTVLHSFTGGTDGGDPQAGLLRDSAGNFYGTTLGGGTGGGGTIFKIDATGKETVLHTFAGKGDGFWPYAGLIRDASGNLYGTTFHGGSNCIRDYHSGCGTVFKVDTNDKWTVLHSFNYHMGDGSYPVAGLIQDASGNLYGTTSSGIVFEVDTNNKETVLYRFTGGADGANPLAGLIQDAAGNLYGTTSAGGANGFGTVFKVDTTGNETVLYSFAGGVDGAGPQAGLLRSANGNLYGTTAAGGDTSCTPSGCGTVFKLDSTGKETVLHSFTGLDGRAPLGGLVRDGAGNLYGTTSAGGAHGFGVVFKLGSSRAAGSDATLLGITGDTRVIPGPNATLSPTSLTFATQVVGSTSAGQMVTLTNNGNRTLRINRIIINGQDRSDFAQTNTCGSRVPPSGSCSITVTFDPTTINTRTARLSVFDNAPGSPQKISLSGTGTVVKLSPTSLSFSCASNSWCDPHHGGCSAPPQTMTLTNTGSTPLSITGITIGGRNAGNFYQTNTCGTSVGAGGSCTITVHFVGSLCGTYTAIMLVYDNGGGSPQTVSLMGTVKP
jgi:uncharacterized repeat protein (TIGR03803 family)